MCNGQPWKILEDILPYCFRKTHQEVYEGELSGRWVVGCSIVQGKTKDDLDQSRGEDKKTCFALEPMYLSSWKWKGFLCSMGILDNVVPLQPF